jgi:phosphonate degradation associated HDIG domain protein
MSYCDLGQIEALFQTKGHQQYAGEPVTQLEHALQTAQLAQADGSGVELITACLLHDVGHMANDLGDSPTLRGVDDRHQFHGVTALKKLFPQAVLAPIRLHVDAKRYLCATDAAYQDNLSEDSKRSLVLQGGIFSHEAAEKFIALPYAQDAARLRRWDDMAKMAGVCTPDLAHFMRIAAQCIH